MLDDLDPVVVGDTYLSQTWAVVVDGQAVDLASPTAGWTVVAHARHPRTGAIVIDWAADGAAVVLGTADVRVGSTTVTTSTVRLSLAPARTALLTPESLLDLEVAIEHPTRGRGGGAYRATVVERPLLVLAVRA